MNKKVVVFVAILIASILFTSTVILSDYQETIDYNSEINLFNNTPGGRAWDYLQNSTYDTILIEVDIVSPYIDERPYDNALNISYLADHFNIVENIVLTECNNKKIKYIWTENTQNYYGDLEYPYYSLSELKKIAETYKNYETEGNNSVVHLIFLDGRYSLEDDIAIGGTLYAGTTIDATTIIIFLPTTVRNTVYAAEYPYLSRDIAHEFGHLLGLVATFGGDSIYNAPNATSHRDADSVRHCSDNLCLMSTSIDKGTELCAECKADLAYLRNTTAPYKSMVEPNIDLIPITSGIIIMAFSGAMIVWKRR